MGLRERERWESRVREHRRVPWESRRTGKQRDRTTPGMAMKPRRVGCCFPPFHMRAGAASLCTFGNGQGGDWELRCVSSCEGGPRREQGEVMARRWGSSFSQWKEPSPSVTKRRSSWKPILERQVLVGKENLLYSGGRQPGEKLDLCPKANSPLPIRGQELSKGSFGGAQAEEGCYVQKQLSELWNQN